jgi:hypothetical protein
MQTTLVLADFDGDHQPDFATVRYQQDGNQTSRYCIRFELSSGSVTDISIVGPVGGLRLVTRDVNGDDFEDVAIYAVWRQEVLAVLLNNGSGQFTLADASGYSLLTTESGEFYRNPSDFRFDDVILAPTRVTPDIQPQALNEAASRNVPDGPPAEARCASTPTQCGLLAGRSPPPASRLI